ncbi:glycerophosphodiester phosphodiesterase family protein [Christiangramia aquimixticola]|uniref:glycerophosphodiester phosphodiesterase family protein n=1 Tax=Christiangramia aquimixticola TaxID=1697558 RepID=UPI003AA82875
MKKRRLIIIVIVFFSIILYLWTPFQSGLFEDDFNLPHNKILVVAHRGSHSRVPENSLEAIQQSINNEIDFVELDVRSTLDNHLIILHDSNLDRTTTGSGPVNQQKLQDVKKYNLRYGNEITNQKIPTLEEALLKARGKILVNLDLKIIDLPDIQQVFHIIEKLNMEESVILSIQDLKLFPKLRKLNESIRLMPVVKTRNNLKKALNLKGVEIIQVKPEKLSKTLIDQIEEKNISIWRNALNKYDRMELRGDQGFKKLISNNRVHIIQTDYPEDLLEFLRTNELHP